MDVTNCGHARKQEQGGAAEWLRPWRMGAHPLAGHVACQEQGADAIGCLRRLSRRAASCAAIK